MFKRRARLLVAAERPDGRAARVAELAGAAEFEDWIEVCPARAMAEITQEDLDWADLLVAVDAAAARGMPAVRPATCRPKYWRLPGETGADFDLQTLEALRCMVGGMRMLARMDAEDDA
ncbi:precorrin-3B synthase [Thioalkalivibrio sp.]|uniref:precorrin-3B synthase n=1 Tax=Thioalkalivibrio sp. TaxID=2093813 RepID=UPI0035626092